MRPTRHEEMGGYSRGVGIWVRGRLSEDRVVQFDC